MAPQSNGRFAPPLSRRTLLRGAAGAVLAPVARRGRAAPPAGIPWVIPWKDVVGGGGSILFYDARRGNVVTGTLDGRGFTPVEEYTGATAFRKGYNVVVGTPGGSVLFVRSPHRHERHGFGIAGTLLDGRWILRNEYAGFADWTNGAATRDSVFLFNRYTGLGASGTLVDGAWTYYKRYRNWTPYSHLVATDDSLLLFKFNSRRPAMAGTLENGLWSYANSYADIGNAPDEMNYRLAVGAGDTLLLLKNHPLDGVAGRLVDGAWHLDHTYPSGPTGFHRWTHAAHAGNGFVLLYDDDGEFASYGTLSGGAWSYYGTT
jgi:hypothetical protein